MRSREPHFARLRLKARLEALPRSPTVPLSGFGYPLSGVSFPGPWESLSTPNAPGLPPSELFSFSVIIRLFRTGLPPLLRFPTKPEGLRAGTSAAYSHGKSRTPYRTLKFFIQVGARCSPGVSDLLGFPHLRPTPKTATSTAYPSRAWQVVTSRARIACASGTCDREAVAFSLAGRQPIWPFRRLSFPYSSGLDLSRTIFSSRSPRFLTKPQVLLFASDSRLPNGSGETVSAPS
jgi:hypothetical protein